MFLSGIIKIGCHRTHTYISRRLLSPQAWIRGNTARIPARINVMYKKPSRLQPSSRLPWRQVFTEPVGVLLRPSWPSSNHISSIRDHISKTSLSSPHPSRSIAATILRTPPTPPASAVYLPSGRGELKQGQTNKAAKQQKPQR